MTLATILCFLILPLLFALLVLWLERRGRFPAEIWKAYQKARAQGRWVSGSWLVTDLVTGDILYHGTWQRAWMRDPPPGRRAGLFRLRE